MNHYITHLHNTYKLHLYLLHMVPKSREAIRYIKCLLCEIFMYFGEEQVEKSTSFVAADKKNNFIYGLLSQWAAFHQLSPPTIGILSE